MKAVTFVCLPLVLLIFIVGAAPAGADPSLIYSTSLGRAGVDVAIDSAGNAFVLSHSDSSYFVGKLSPSGELIFERPLELPPRAPAAPPREPSAIAIDPAGFIYIAGVANYGYICCEQGTDEANAGFVTKLGPDGTGLIYDTIFLEGANTHAHDLAVDALGQAHVRYTSSWPDLYGIQVSAGVSFSPAGSGQGYFGYSPNAPYSYVNAISMGLSGDLFAVGWQYPDSYTYALDLQRTDASSGAVFETLIDDSGTIELLDVAGGPGGSSAVVGMVGSIVPPGVPEGGGFYIAGFGPEGEEVLSRVLNLGAVVISDIAMTSSGEIVLAGWSGSSSGAFVLRLDGGTGQVLSSITLGSSGYRRVDAVAVGPGGDAYV
ncbi:MAG TPA: hypothetical protein VK899_10555, partial [Gemmatimonadales bacterium]|nr:hypothetical protein [Gemmatimonadales bacterium]